MYACSGELLHLRSHAMCAAIAISGGVPEGCSPVFVQTFEVHRKRGSCLLSPVPQPCEVKALAQKHACT